MASSPTRTVDVRGPHRATGGHAHRRRPSTMPLPHAGHSGSSTHRKRAAGWTITTATTAAAAGPTTKRARYVPDEPLDPDYVATPVPLTPLPARMVEDDDDMYYSTQALIGTKCTKPPPFEDDTMRLDSQPIDLSIYMEGLQAINCRVDKVREAVAIAYQTVVEMEDLSGREVKMTPLRKMFMRTQSTDGSVSNIFAGRTQLGKTEIVAGALYLSAVGLSLIGIGLVRNAGGNETIETLKGAIDDISSHVVAALRRDRDLNLTDDELAFFLPEVVKAQMLGRKYRNPYEGRNMFRGRTRGLILVDRNNTTTLKMLFQSSRFVDDWNECAGLLTDPQSHLLRYALVIDEDDEGVASVDRNFNMTERLHHNTAASQIIASSPLTSPTKATPMVFTIDSSESSDDDYMYGLITPQSNVVGGRNVEDGCEEDDNSDLRNLLSAYVNSPRGNAKLIAITTATWAAIGMIIQSVVKQPILVLPIPIKSTYKGLYAEEPEDPDLDFVRWEKHVPPGVTGSSINDFYSETLPYITSRLADRYMKIRNGTYQGEDKFISLHFNSHKTKLTMNAEVICKYFVLDSFVGKAKIPVIGFTWNSKAQKRLFISSTLNQIAQHQGESIKQIVEKFMNFRNINGAIVEWANDVEFPCLTIDKTKSKFRLISAMYDLIGYIYDTLDKGCVKREAKFMNTDGKFTPFIVCVSGHMGGRGLTLKDSDRKFLLTDQFIDFADMGQPHYEGMIQAAGRICSVDNVPVARRLWISPKTARKLREAIQFYDELTNIVVTSVKEPMKLEDILTKVTSDDETIIGTIEGGKLITRARVNNLFRNHMKEAVKGLLPQDDDEEENDDWDDEYSQNEGAQQVEPTGAYNVRDRSTTVPDYTPATDRPAYMQDDEPVLNLIFGLIKLNNRFVPSDLLEKSARHPQTNELLTEREIIHACMDGARRQLLYRSTDEYGSHWCAT